MVVLMKNYIFVVLVFMLYNGERKEKTFLDNLKKKNNLNFFVLLI